MKILLLECLLLFHDGETNAWLVNTEFNTIKIFNPKEGILYVD